MKISRRRFLRQMGTLGKYGGIFLTLDPLVTSCTTLDRIFLGDERDLTQEVVILGGGAAGLMAAYTLKLNQVPYQIFEASARPGGRVLTMHGLSSSENQPIDLGAEWFYSTDTVLVELAKNLRVELVEEKRFTEASRFFFDGKSIDPKKWNQSFLKLSSFLQSVYPKNQDEVQKMDQKKVEDIALIAQSEIAPWMGSWIRTYCLQMWGVDSDQISLFPLMQKFKVYPNLYQSVTERRWRAKWGTSNLIQSLFERATGILLQHSFNAQHEWVRAKEEKGIFHLYFQTPQGEKLVRTQQVICTIPYSTLRHVEGLENLNWNTENKIRSINEIGYGIQTKMALDVPADFIPEISRDGLFWGNFSTQSFWQRTAALRWPKKWDRGVLMGQRGGLGAMASGDTTIEDFRKDAQLMSSKRKDSSPIYHVHSWGDYSYTLGSHSFFKPGQVTRWQSQFKSPEYEGRWLFAGEHTSDFHRGTLNGALETGQQAALKLIQLRKENPI